MSSILTIDPKMLPYEGRQIKGHLPPSFFQLDENDPVRCIGDMEFDIVALKDGKNVNVTGTLRAPFSLQCGRCAERFEFEADLSDYDLEIEIEKDQMIDLTEPLREDILLALPSYPRCEDGNISPRECPEEGRFDTIADPLIVEEEKPADSDKAVWNVLDQLKKQ